jgi:hypothetical protein
MLVQTCVICRREVDPAENWVKCHVWAAFGIFHWDCFGEFLHRGAPQKLEDVVWRASTAK